MRHRLGALVPADGIEVEALHQARCPGPQLGRQRGQDLQPRGGYDRAEAELGSRSGDARQEERLRLVRSHPRQPRPVAVDQADSTVRTALGVDRHAGGGQRLDVAMDGPFRDFELRGELGGSQPAATLEEQEQRNEAGGAHGRRIARFMP